MLICVHKLYSTDKLYIEKSPIKSDFLLLVRVTGLEPARGYHQNLNLACLPVSPHPHI